MRQGEPCRPEGEQGPWKARQPGDEIDETARAIVARQLGRSPRGLAGVARWCSHGCPAVVSTRPYLEEGTPFPTGFYLTCPSARSRVATLEAAGGVRRLRERTEREPGLRAALLRLDDVCRAQRRALLPPGAREEEQVDGGWVLERGVGGAGDPARLTCLHAVTAALLAALGGEADESRVQSEVGAGTVETWRGLVAEMGDLWCEDAGCLAGGRPERRAAIDVGTNSVRLLVADLRAESGRLIPAPVVRRAEVTRLGEGLTEGGLLHEEAKVRTRQAVERYVAEARARGASRVTVVGTSATRRAGDGAAFMQQIGSELGVTAGVATGRVEALMAYSGATLDVPGDVVLLDVGGGSTELVRWVDDERPTAVSLDLGCVRATEEWIHADPPAAGERAVVREEALRLVGREAADFKGADALVAVAGTATTLAAHSLKLDRYRPEVVHLTMLNRAQVEAALEELAAVPVEVRAALPYMQPERADVIIAGAEILVAAMDALEYSLVLVSERDILDGIILAHAG